MEQNVGNAKFNKKPAVIVAAVIVVLAAAVVVWWRWPKSGVERNAGLITPAVTSAPLAPGNPQGEAKFRVYNIKVNKDGFSIPKVTVNNGDTVQFNLTAEDAKYDFSVNYFGFYAIVPKGATKVVSLDADRGPGTYEFSCASFCPASGKISGELEVLK